MCLFKLRCLLRIKKRKNIDQDKKKKKTRVLVFERSWIHSPRKCIQGDTLWSLSVHEHECALELDCHLLFFTFAEPELCATTGILFYFTMDTEWKATKLWQDNCWIWLILFCIRMSDSTFIYMCELQAAGIQNVSFYLSKLREGSLFNTKTFWQSNGQLEGILAENIHYAMHSYIHYTFCIYRIHDIYRMLTYMHLTFSNSKFITKSKQEH